jgi:peptidoglycan hydrolase-like protein with peptidoglycan-binding domain
MRLFALVFIGLATAISVNALYLQDARYAAGGANMAAQQDAVPRNATAALPSAENSKAGPSSGETAPAAVSAAKPAPRPRLPKAEPKRAPEQLAAAIRRELSRHHYDAGTPAADGDTELRAAILAFEFDEGLPMTGEVSETILKSLLFAGGGRGEAGSPERFESRRRLVAEVQEMLSGLGYGGGPADGRVDDRTRDAIRKFETDRNLAEGGRLTARVLLEMVIVSGRPFAANG